MNINRNTLLALAIVAAVIIVGMAFGVVTEVNISDLFSIVKE